MNPPFPIPPNGTVVTVGTFDGIHLGHRAVLQETSGRGAEAQRRSVLVTFEPHPPSIVNPQMGPPLLTTGGERREALALTSLDNVWVVRFDRELASLEPDQFTERLVDQLGMK